MRGSATAADDEPIPARPNSRPSRRDTRRESSGVMPWPNSRIGPRIPNRPKRVRRRGATHRQTAPAGSIGDTHARPARDCRSSSPGGCPSSVPSLESLVKGVDQLVDAVITDVVRRVDVDAVARRLDVMAVLDRLDLTEVVLSRVDLQRVVREVLTRLDAGDPGRGAGAGRRRRRGGPAGRGRRGGATRRGGGPRPAQPHLHRAGAGRARRGRRRGAGEGRPDRPRRADHRRGQPPGDHPGVDRVDGLGHGPRRPDARHRGGPDCEPCDAAAVPPLPESPPRGRPEAAWRST